MTDIPIQKMIECPLKRGEGMILTNRQIRETCEREEIVISPFELRQIQPASYDFRVGEQKVEPSRLRSGRRQTSRD